MANTPEGTPYVESSDLVANYPAASLALANRVDLVGVLPFASAAARTTAIPSPTDGQYSYLQDTNATEFWNGAAWQAAGTTQKIVQVIRATDSTNRSTTSTSYVDASISVTITPTKNTSAILLLAKYLKNTDGNTENFFQITDSSNVAISGAQEDAYYTTTRFMVPGTSIAWATPATLSAVTYKLRFRNVNANPTTIMNATSTGQFYAIEVSA